MKPSRQKSRGATCLKKQIPQANGDILSETRFVLINYLDALLEKLKSKLVNNPSANSL